MNIKFILIGAALVIQSQAFANTAPTHTATANINLSYDLGQPGGTMDFSQCPKTVDIVMVPGNSNSTIVEEGCGQASCIATQGNEKISVFYRFSIYKMKPSKEYPHGEKRFWTDVEIMRKDQGGDGQRARSWSSANFDGNTHEFSIEVNPTARRSDVPNFPDSYNAEVHFID